MLPLFGGTSLWVKSHQSNTVTYIVTWGVGMGLRVNRHLRLGGELFPPHSVHASAPWLFEKHWPFTAATDRRWWSAWQVVVRQVGLISLWVGWCCSTLQKILLWACKAPSQAVTFLGRGKENHQLSWRDPWRKRAHRRFLLGGGVALSVCLFKWSSVSLRATECTVLFWYIHVIKQWVRCHWSVWCLCHISSFMLQDATKDLSKV